MAEYALLRLPPPPSACAAEACAALTLYRSPPTPDFTSEAPAVDVTRAMVSQCLDHRVRDVLRLVGKHRNAGEPDALISGARQVHGIGVGGKRKDHKVSPRVRRYGASHRGRYCLHFYAGNGRPRTVAYGAGNVSGDSCQCPCYLGQEEDQKQNRDARTTKRSFLFHVRLCPLMCSFRVPRRMRRVKLACETRLCRPFETS